MLLNGECPRNWERAGIDRLKMARSEGLEPPTPWFEAKYSIQLSYERNGVWMIILYFWSFYAGGRPEWWAV